MKNRWIATACFLVLGGCATFSHMEKGLTGLVGMPAQSAFEHLGFPSAEERIAGHTVYIWKSDNSYSVPILTDKTTTGKIGAKPFTASTTTTEYLPVRERCVLRVMADDEGVIRKWDFSGNIGGCEQYGKRLRRVSRT